MIGGMQIPVAELDRLVHGGHPNPHSVLGMHPTGDGRTVVRTLRPGATAVDYVVGRERAPMGLIHDEGIFEVIVDGDPTDYRLEVDYGDGVRHRADDPYRWLPTVPEFDLQLISAGKHEDLWTVLGSHTRRFNTPNGPVDGTSFAVWAPNARAIRLAGDFDYWSGRGLPMRSLGASGIWELFVPGVGDGARYKFHVLGADNRWREKADPMAFHTEVPPANASVVHTPRYKWQDAAWLKQRAETAWHAAPISIYEVHLGSWRQGKSYVELAEELVEHVTTQGYTHVELLPVAEHPFGGSWGYQVTSYFAPTARFGSPDEFRFLVDKLHQAGIGVIADWVPAHFPKDEWALARFDGTPLYEHPDPSRGEHPDWGTYVFDFGRPEVRNFLIANAVYWLEEFHVDGLRVDAVASMLYLDYSREPGEWTPNAFGGREDLDAVALLQDMNSTVYRRVPGAMTIAEESTAWPGVTKPTDQGGLGFGFKWDLGWMHDTLSYVGHQPVHRQYHHHEMTFSMMYAFSENFVLPLSHDEVVHGKGSLLTRIPGDRWQQFATLRALFGYMWGHPGKQLLFMGQEFAQGGEWAEQRSLDWWLLDDPDHQGLARLVADLNREYRGCEALWSRDTDQTAFRWIEANDAGGNVFSWLRFGHSETVACIANFSAVPHEGYRLGLPFAGRWDEIINTDARYYAGTGNGNAGGMEATAEPLHGLPASAIVTIPPLATVWLRFRA
jgi:1,4-alpha-glucan branching enzyme